jgi:ribonuclease R
VPSSQTSSDGKLHARILTVLRKRKQRALHASEIRGRIGWDRTRHAEVLALLEDLAAKHMVVKLPGERYRALLEPPPHIAAEPAAPVTRGGGERGHDGRGALKPARGRELVGRMMVNARGFGFVATDEVGPDVFIPPGYLGAALHGDRVRVRARPSLKGLEGRVVAVVQRTMQFVGGQLHLGQHGAFIEPDDDRLRMPIVVKGRVPPEARTGMGAIAKVLAYPERDGEPPEVRIVELFEPEAFVQYEIRRVLLRDGVSEEFPAEVQAEADALPHAITARDRKGREDLRSIPLMTIDPADARDHDDAVWAGRLDGGGYRVLVAIADVSHYVREGSALDKEAIERGCTIYLPTRAIPMLPHALSSNLASLLAKRDRLTLAVDIELDAQGDVVDHRFVEGVMRSAADLTYEGVAQALGLTVHGPNDAEAQAHLPELTLLLEVAKLLREKRRARGALEFELPEAKVRVDDETGHPTDVERSRKDPGVARAYGMIEELMLLANEVVAADLTERGVPAIYRVHGAPDPERIETFCALAKALGFDLDEDAAQKPKQLARFLAGVQGTPHATALGYLLLRSMKQATYDVDNIGHFGLAADYYSHFTSPIRRYPDLALHRIVRAVARGQRVDDEELPARLKSQAEQSSQRERRAMAIEREIVDLYGAYLMRDQVGECFDATISGVADHGFYATLDKPFVDVLCRTATLPHDRYELDAHGVKLRGVAGGRTYALGDRVRLRIEDVSLAQRKVSAAPAEMPQAAAARSASPHQRPSKRPSSAPRGDARRKKSRADGRERKQSRGKSRRGKR